MPNTNYQFGKRKNKGAKAQQRRRLLEKARKLQQESEINLNIQIEPTSSGRNASPPPSNTGIQPSIESSFEEEGLEEYELITETEKICIDKVDGRRIVDIEMFTNQILSLQYTHSQRCTLGLISVHGEKRLGLASILTLKCSMCNTTWIKSTVQDVDQTKKTRSDTFNLNKSVVWGTLSSGSTFTKTEELLSVLNIPMISKRLFIKIEQNLEEIWQEYLDIEIKQAGENEKKIAIEKGNVDADGVPWATVYIDGGWSKRTYGHNFNANSGTAVVIGKETKKVLFLGVRNKYCSVCATTQKSHHCYKNWDGSSTAMESDILVEGFNLSLDVHGIRYKKIIADGDSSVYFKLKRNVGYGSQIQKIECVNHCLKNYKSALYKILLNTKLPLKGRSILKASIHRLPLAAKKAIEHNSTQGTVEDLRFDLINGPKHVFGDHTNCREYFCKKRNEQNLCPILEELGMTPLISGAIERLVRLADRLISNQNSNRAELFMSILAKFNAGKRLNLTNRGSFQRRCALTALSYQRGYGWHTNPWKASTKRSPGRYFKKYLLKRDKLSKKKAVFKKAKKISHGPDIDYGPNALDDDNEYDIFSTSFEEKLLKTLHEFEVSQIDIANIEKRTIGQHGNVLYDHLRENRLTASNFGLVCKRRNISCAKLVKKILYSNPYKSTSMSYGIEHEAVAVSMFESKHDKYVRKCGLFIDAKYGFLAASPDGVIDDENAIVEVKCVPSLNSKNMTLEEAATSNNNFFLQIVDGCLRLKETHNYYYQIQGQLHIAQKNYCYFIVFVNSQTDIFVQKVEKNSRFWMENIPKLDKFFKECMLTEIILRRANENKTLICRNKSHKK